MGTLDPVNLVCEFCMQLTLLKSLTGVATTTKSANKDNRSGMKITLMCCFLICSVSSLAWHSSLDWVMSCQLIDSLQCTSPPRFPYLFLPIPCRIFYLSPLSPCTFCAPASTGFTGAQAPTGAAGAPEEDGAAASRAGAGETAT